MSFERVWPHLAALHCDALTAHPVEWKVLYANRPRPLLVPARSAAQARAAVNLFVAGRMLRWWGHLLLLLDRWLPRSRLLPSARLDRFPVDGLFGDSARTETRFAVHCGSPGPLSKLTIVCPAQDREAQGAIAKVALLPSADDTVTREAYWLRTLGELPAVARFLPRLLKDGILPCGRRFVTMSVLSNGTRSPRFGEQHLRFLEVLARRDGRVERWSATDAFRRLHRRIDTVAALVEPRQRAFFVEILQEIEREIGERRIPVCLVHGDFAEWNLRAAADELYVFDWEYAQAGGNPLHDFLHFHLIGRATRQRIIDNQTMRCLLVRAAAYAERIFGCGNCVAAAAGPLALHYLLDTVTFYVEASRHLDIRHPVIRAYLGLFDRRNEWLSRPNGAKGASDGRE